MFGYIKAEKGELKVREYETYKAVYCTLCKVMGKRYTPLLRFTLSYDFAFLAMLNAAMSQNKICYERKRCTCNPLKKCVYCSVTDDFFMPSAAAVIMLYYKLNDNVSDEGFFKGLGFRFLKLIYHGSYKKAVKNYPHIQKITQEYIEKQKTLEDKKCGNIDKAADPTAVCLGEIFELCSDNPQKKRILNRLGYCLGRYIYILDAAVDLEKDRKKGSYNPIIFSDMLQNDENVLKEQLNQTITTCAVEAQRAYELLDIKRYNTILGNILYLGLESVQKKELKL